MTLCSIRLCRMMKSALGFWRGCSKSDKAADIEIRAFLDYIKNKRPTDSFTNTIDLAVKKVKEDESLRGFTCANQYVFRMQNGQQELKLQETFFV